MDLPSNALDTKLLNDEHVKQAMKVAGEQALTNPTVQQAIIDAAKSKLTKENAEAVAQHVRDWANDPEVQAKARHFAGMAMEQAGQIGQAFVGCIEQGTEGVRVLAFFAGLASAAVAIRDIVFSFMSIKVVSVSSYAFQAFFAFSTMLFEAKPEWIAKVSFLSTYQDMLMVWFKFITTTHGRGLFYTFQGTFWLMEDWTDFIVLGVGAYMVFIGFLNILTHYGIMPETVAAKAKEIVAGYQSVPEPRNGASPDAEGSSPP